MESSYCMNHYGEIFSFITKQLQPQTIIEFGILEGYSLTYILRDVPSNCSITAYDLFDTYPYRHANYNNLITKFPMEIIKEGDFYLEYKNIPDNSIDLLHIDISNTGKVYEFFLQYYYPKLTPRGLAILEGGSIERDQIPWMLQYKASPIYPVLQKCSKRYFTFQAYPSLTVIWKT